MSDKEIEALALQLSQQHPEFKLWGMWPLWEALVAADRAVLSQPTQPAIRTDSRYNNAERIFGDD